MHTECTELAKESHAAGQARPESPHGEGAACTESEAVGRCQLGLQAQHLGAQSTWPLPGCPPSSKAGESGADHRL